MILALLQLGQGLRHRLTERGAGAHQLPLGRELFLVVRLGRKRLQLLHRMTQEILVAPCRRRGGLGIGARLLGRPPGLPGRPHRGALPVEAGEGIERGAVRRHVQQPVLLHLALDLDQRVAQPAQQRDRRRLVVDEGPAAAVGADGAAQGQHVLVVDPLFGQDGVGGMIPGEIEGGGDGGLRGAAAHRVGVRARAQGQAQRIDQDRLAGAGLAGQRAQAAARIAREGKVELLDQDEVTDRKRDKHRRPTRTIRGTCAACPRTQAFLRRSSDSRSPDTSRYPGS